MFSKLSTRVCLIVGASLIVAGAAVFLHDSSASASTGGRSCELQSAKNVTAFPAGTTFSIRKGLSTYTYSCDWDAPRWTESIYTPLLPGQVVGGDSGALSSDDAPSNPTNTGGGVLQ